MSRIYTSSGIKEISLPPVDTHISWEDMEEMFFVEDAPKDQKPVSPHDDTPPLNFRRVRKNKRRRSYGEDREYRYREVTLNVLASGETGTLRRDGGVAISVNGKARIYTLSKIIEAGRDGISKERFMANYPAKSTGFNNVLKHVRENISPLRMYIDSPRGGNLRLVIM